MEASPLASSSPSTTSAAAAASGAQTPSRQRSLRQRQPSRTTRQSSLASSAGAAGKAPHDAQGAGGAAGSKRRRKKDRHAAALESIRDFLKGRSCYDGLPVSFRLIVLDTKLIVKPALEVMWQAGVVSAPLWHSTTLPDASGASPAADTTDNALSSSMLLSDPASDSTPGSALSKLPPRQALKPGFAGMLTVNDIIHLIQYYYRHSSYDNAAQDVEHFRLEMLRDIERSLGVPQPPLLSVSPLRPLYEACQLLIKTHARRLPLLDYDEQTGIETVLSVLTQYRVLKFIAMNCTETAGLQRSIRSLGIGTYTKSTMGVGSAREAQPRTPASRSGSGTASRSGSGSGNGSGSGSAIVGGPSSKADADPVEALLKQNPDFQGLSISEDAPAPSTPAGGTPGAEGISPSDRSHLPAVTDDGESSAEVTTPGAEAKALESDDPDATPGLTGGQPLGGLESITPSAEASEEAAMLASPMSEPAGGSGGGFGSAYPSFASKSSPGPTSPFAAMYEPLYTATLDTTVFDVVHVFSERGISAVPILDDEGYAVDMYETVDVIDLVRSGMYQSLDLTIRQALARRPADFAGVMSCSPDDSLASIFALLRTRRVHRLLILEPEEDFKKPDAEAAGKEGQEGDNGSTWPARDAGGDKTDAAQSLPQYRERGRGKLVGILCLSDILKYLIGTMEKEDAELAAQEEARRNTPGGTRGSVAASNTSRMGTGMAGAGNAERSRTGSQGSQASSAAPMSSAYGSMLGVTAAGVGAGAGAAGTAVVSEDEEGGAGPGAGGRSRNPSGSSLVAAGAEASDEADPTTTVPAAAAAAAGAGGSTRPSELAEPQPTIPEDEVLDLDEVKKVEDARDAAEGAEEAEEKQKEGGSEEVQAQAQAGTGEGGEAAAEGEGTVQEGTT